MARSWVRVAAAGGTAPTSPLAGGVFLLVACVLAVASVVSALCAAHRRKEKRAGEDGRAWSTDSPAESPGFNFQTSFKFAPKSPRALMNTISSKKFLLAKKWGRSEDEELKAYDRAVMEDGGDFLWQRTILMGERCQPPDFSGVIIYDHKGNRLPEFPPRSPKLNVFHPSLEAEGVQQR